MPKSIFRALLNQIWTSTHEPQDTAPLINKVMVMGAVLLLVSAFVFIKNHSITSLILGVSGIALLIAGATKEQQVRPAATLPVMILCKKCRANCESDWSYCAQCGFPLKAHSKRVGAHYLKKGE